MWTSILVVDDDEDFLERVTAQLQQIPDADISVAHDVKEALALLREKCFDLIVTDWSLDSHTASELLSNADPLLSGRGISLGDDGKTPVLLMSGSEKIGAAAALRSLQHFEPVSFILKRCGPPLIGRLAENILERFDSHREVRA